MNHSSRWTETCHLSKLRAADLQTDGVVFRQDCNLYRTTGKHLSNGGMGSVFIMERFSEDSGAVEPVVGKTFHSQYLYQLRTDDITRREHEANLHAMELLSRTEHPNLLPTYLSAQIADNHLLVSPLLGYTLHECVARGRLSPRQRVVMLIQALHGLCALHETRLIHRDVTLRNIILDPGHERALLFDFDLTMSLDEVIGVN
ncbi:MAG: protein kinase, partial [Myxococcota bacterium]